MSHRSFFIAVIVLVLSFSSSAQTQGPASAGGSEESAALKKKAVDLLVTVAGQIDSLRSAENRARIGSNAAESLWDHDEKRARSLFAAVAEDVKTGLTDADPDAETHNHTLLVFWQLRSDTLGRIAKHDPELALQFLRATRLPADVQLPYETSDTEKSQELRLAGQVAAKNPDLALKLGRESLALGFSADLLSMLSTLQSTNKVAALTFYQEIVDKLKTTDLAHYPVIAQFAFALADKFQPPETDERVYRELIGLLLTSALANGCGKASPEDGPEICYQIRSIFPRLEKYYGPRAAALKQWANDEQDAETSLGWWEQAREVIEKGTVDEMLAFAEKYPESRYDIYSAAIRKAEDSGDFARARELASDFPNAYERSRLLAEVSLAEKRNSINPDNPATVQQALGTFRDNEERAKFLVAAAMRISGRDRKRGLELLDQSGQFIDSLKPGKNQLEGKIVLAMLYCSLKSDRGFAIMESLMPKLNEVVTASAALDGFENKYLTDGEWNMTGEGVVGGLLTSLAQNIGYFAWQDFDRSVTLASQLERPELRLMAELKIAQSALADRPNPAIMFQSTSRVD